MDEEFEVWLDKVLPGRMTKATQEASEAEGTANEGLLVLLAYFELEHAKDYVKRRENGKLTSEEQVQEEYFKERFPDRFPFEK